MQASIAHKTQTSLKTQLPYQQKQQSAKQSLPQHPLDTKKIQKLMINQ